MKVKPNENKVITCSIYYNKYNNVVVNHFYYSEMDFMFIMYN